MKICLPIIVILSAFIISVTIVMNMYSYTMDTYFGKGVRRVSNPQGTESWDAEYYDKMFDATGGGAGSLKYAENVCKKITDEGIVLLKNNGVLPLVENKRVTPFGYRYLYPVYGGTGSGSVNAAKTHVTSAEEGIAKNLDINDATVRAMRSARPKEMSADRIADAIPSADGNSFTGADTSLYEYDPSIYGGGETCKNTAGLVFIGRVGGEGGNLKHTSYFDGTPHSLALTSLEKETVEYSKKHCRKTVAIVNSSYVMEIGELLSGRYECDAVVWIGGPGATGFDSLSDILAGKVNPSGRTVDIWAADLLENPAQANFEDIRYSNSLDHTIASNYKDDAAGLYFIEYEEGIYVGYRYYETAADLGQSSYGSIDAQGKILANGAVNYPFGYGLSYSAFEQSIKSFSDAGDTVSVSVEVKNKGNIAGKETVQIYYEPPYTRLDQTLNTEKASKNLIAFDKIEVDAGETKIVDLIFYKDDMASYCYTRTNSDGTKGCYYLAEGEYRIILGKNSHSAWDERIFFNHSTVWHEGADLRHSDRLAQTQLDDDGNYLHFPKKAMRESDAQYFPVSNRFEDVSDYMHKTDVTVLTRKNWRNTQPTAPSVKQISAERLAQAVSYDPFTDVQTGNDALGSIYGSEPPVSNVNNNLKFSDLRGKDYYDPLWDDLLDQLDYYADDLYNMLLYSAYGTRAVEAISKPATRDIDGPQGWGLAGSDTGDPTSFMYCTEVVVSSSFNVGLAYEFGKSIGQEALTSGINGWYGPGLNIHRNPFIGRNYEYYSEDPLLSGKIAAHCISGAADQGVVCYVKHFAMNNYEGPATCLAVWATEQAIREIYLKSFEIAFKEARMTIKYISDNEGRVSTKTMSAALGVMAAANMIGTHWCAANYDLLENVLRGEWGFQGAVTTDMALQITPGVNDKLLRAGSDLRLSRRSGDLIDKSTPAALWTFRRAVKNACYAHVNGNIMQGAVPGAIVNYGMAPWAITLLIANIVVFGIILFLIVFLCVKGRY